MPINSFLTQNEVAEALRLSPRTLERYRITGAGPKYVKMGRRILYKSDDINAWVNQRTFASTSEADAVMEGERK